MQARVTCGLVRRTRELLAISIFISSGPHFWAPRQPPRIPVYLMSETNCSDKVPPLRCVIISLPDADGPRQVQIRKV